MILAAKKIRQVSKLIPAASKEILLDALGPKCFVMISIHIKDSQDIRIPPSSAIQSSCNKVLLANRFMQITLTTNNVTTMTGIDLNRISVSSFSFFIHDFILLILIHIPFIIILLLLILISIHDYSTFHAVNLLVKLCEIAVLSVYLLGIAYLLAYILIRFKLFVIHFSSSNDNFNVSVQDGGDTGAKAGVKLAYKHVFAPVFTSEEPPMLLARPWPGKKMLTVLYGFQVSISKNQSQRYRKMKNQVSNAWIFLYWEISPPKSSRISHFSRKWVSNQAKILYRYPPVKSYLKKTSRSVTLKVESSTAKSPPAQAPEGKPLSRLFIVLISSSLRWLPVWLLAKDRDQHTNTTNQPSPLHLISYALFSHPNMLHSTYVSYMQDMYPVFSLLKEQ